jgi:hypothetical protein
MGLGTHPAFLDSAARPAMPPPRKGEDGPATSQLPIVAGFYFTMQRQEQSNWCSPAVATSISRYYSPNSSWTQCGVVNSALGRSDCCASPGSTACNVGNDLSITLGVTDNFESQTGPLTKEAVMLHLMAGHPVAARVQWYGGGGHAVAITGYSFFMQAHRYEIHDPIYGYSFIFVQQFETNYQGAGFWSDSYLTKGPSP